ncbi:MAG: hypothetical protein R3F11_31250 [Verrucomicrobiales bacterium]
MAHEPVVGKQQQGRDAALALFGRDQPTPRQLAFLVIAFWMWRHNIGLVHRLARTPCSSSRHRHGHQIFSEGGYLEKQNYLLTGFSIMPSPRSWVIARNPHRLSHKPKASSNKPCPLHPTLTPEPQAD